MFCCIFAVQNKQQNNNLKTNKMKTQLTKKQFETLKSLLYRNWCCQMKKEGINDEKIRECNDTFMAYDIVCAMSKDITKCYWVSAMSIVLKPLTPKMVETAKTLLAKFQKNGGYFDLYNTYINRIKFVTE